MNSSKASALEWQPMTKEKPKHIILWNMIPRCFSDWLNLKHRLSGRRMYVACLTSTGVTNFVFVCLGWRKTERRSEGWIHARSCGVNIPSLLTSCSRFHVLVERASIVYYRLTLMLDVNGMFILSSSAMPRPSSLCYPSLLRASLGLSNCVSKHLVQISSYLSVLGPARICLEGQALCLTDSRFHLTYLLESTRSSTWENVLI